MISGEIIVETTRVESNYAGDSFNIFFNHKIEKFFITPWDEIS